MNYLLDTCVLSEYTKRHPDGKVIRWVDTVDETDLYLCVLTLGEIKKGIELMPESKRKDDLSLWLNNVLLKRFSDRLYSINDGIMLAWGSLYARLQSSGNKMPLFDSLIAAACLYHNAILVTRNEADFIPAGVELVNPWKE